MNITRRYKWSNYRRTGISKYNRHLCSNFLGRASIKEGPFQPLELIRYQDDCFDVELNKTEEEINEFTDFFNQLVPGIKFKPKITSDHLEIFGYTCHN